MKLIKKMRVAVLMATAFLMSLGAYATEMPELPQDSLTLQEVVVTGSRPSVNVNNLPMSVSVIPQAQIERRMEQSVLPILTEQVPGLFVSSIGVMGYLVSNGAAGSISIRGIGGGAQMLMLIDGHPQYMGIMGHPLADSYQSLMTERIEVVRGPVSVLYGSNAMGGVVNLITKQEKAEGVKTRVKAMYGSFNTLTTEASNAVRKGKFSSYASFGYNRSDGHRENMKFNQYSGYAKVGYDFTRNWLAYADVDITNYDASNPFSTYAPRLDYDMDITRGVTSFSLQNNYDRTSGALKFYYNFGYHKIDDGYSPGGEPRDGLYRSRDKMLGITAYQNYSLFKGNQTTVGIDYQHFGGRAWNIFRSGAPEKEIVRESLNEVAGYVNFQQLFWDKLSVNAGVRIDHHSVAGNEWIPQFGISWFAAENTIVKGIVSKGFRNPTLRELFMWNYNRDLKPESLWNYELSLIQSLLDKKLSFGLNLYYIKGKNSILQPDGVPTLINTGELENYGLEVDTRYRILPNFSINGNYSYLHMKHTVEGAPEHKLYVGGDYRLDKWTFSTGIQFITGLTRGGALAEDNKETFTLWNARVSYRANKWLDIFARGENLLAQKYEINRGYPMPRATVFGGFSLNL